MKCLSILFLIVPSFLMAQPDIKFQLAHSGFSIPVDISDPEDGTDRLFIVEKAGRIKVIENDVVLSANFLDIVSQVEDRGERGLLGLVFHPDYENNGFFYVNYVDNSDKTTIARWKVSDDKNIADPNSEKVLFTIQQPRSNHNAGDLNFSPSDGFLYIAMGDGGGGGDPECNAQDSASMLGKILRVDVNTSDIPPYYTIPTGNPFVGNSSVDDRIWAFGLRNPWRVSFDRKTGDYWLADVGQGLHEEINFVPAGSAGPLNFGWKAKEGTSCYDNSGACGTTNYPLCNSDAYYDPIFQTNRTDETGARSITGGYVYRGCKYPELVGKYICTDYATDNSWYMGQDGNATLFRGGAELVTSYGEDHNGELYVCNIEGNVYRVIDDNAAKTLTLNAEDYPLSGAYLATEQIIINSPLNQNLNGVKFMTKRLTLAENVSIPEGSNVEITTDFCNE